MGVPDDPSTELLPQEPGTARAVPEPAASLIGRTLGGRFTIVEELGRGGSGEVYRADQTQLGRSAVIKVLRRDVAAAGNRVERFLREAKLASRLDHPYAAHVYAFGAEADHVLWIAMEHVRGITLDELVAKRGAVPANIFAPLFARLCEVVHTAHELGIVHRDIKGANVMVIERAGQLLPKLLDFGIAKADAGETAPGVDSGDLTGHGATLGSPQYMSPEQWTRPADVDARADIYALGVLAYRCLAGHLPFHTTNRHGLADAHARQPVPPLPDFVSAPLADAVLRALDKEPERRWQTAVAFADSIVRATGAETATEPVPIFDTATRDAWLRAGPQPIADAVAHLTGARTTLEADTALRELVAITCRWLAVLSLAGLPASGASSNARVRDRARAVTGRDDGAPWLELARAAVAATLEPLPALVGALAGADRLAALAARLDERERTRTSAALAADVATAAEALGALEALLAYQLVVGTSDGSAESWQGPRRRDRERVLIWGPPLAAGEVALLDATNRVIARLSPFAQVLAPLPSAEPELFLLWRSGRGAARLVAAPWGFERDDERAAHVLAVLSTEDSDTAIDAEDTVSPYPGLAAYGVDDADHFVGREREVEALLNRMVRSPLVAVLGPSGVGKSSFIHAGLVARLGSAYRVLTMRPGRHPMHALAALPPVSGDSHDESGLAARLRELGESAQRGVVLVIDQLEELVTLCADPAERTRFAETLAAAADGPSAPVRVVATLRDDFATVIESEAALRGQFDVFVLAAPAADALRRIVVEPARRANVTVDPQVVDDMVTAVAGRPASLPLLSFTAAQLWQTRDRAARKITYDAYQQLGGVAGALATYADEVYASLARSDQETLRELFARLVAADGTRIPSPRRELEQLPGARGVLAHLVDARLLVVRDDEGTDVVEIVHECLAERWPRLARWRTEDAADRALLTDVRAAARRWHDGARSPDLLWRGEAVRELARLSTRSALTDLERAFATEAVSAQRRARRLRRGIVGATMVALVAVAGVMAYLSIAANESRTAAEQSAVKAASSAQLAEERLTTSLIAQGRRELNDNRALPALAYFGAALERGADSQGLRAMVSIAARGWRDTLMSYRGSHVNAVAASPSGWVAAGDTVGTLRWWNDKGEPLGELATELGGIYSIDLQPDDSILVVGHNGILHLSPARTIIRRIPTAEPMWFAQLGPAADELVAAGPKRLFVYGFDGKVRRTVETERLLMGNEPKLVGHGRYALLPGEETIRHVDLLTLREKTITTTAFGAPAVSGDGMRWAFPDSNHLVRVFAADGTPVVDIEQKARPNAVVLSQSGDRIAIAEDDKLVVYDAAGTRLRKSPLTDTQTIYALRGDDIWTGGTDGVLRRFSNGELVASIPTSATELLSVRFARDAIAVTAGDTSLTLLRVTATQVAYSDEICRKVVYSARGIAVGYECGDTAKLYVGRQHIGDYPVSDTEILVDVLPAHGLAALAGSDGIRIYERGTRIAHAPGRNGSIAFASRDILFLADREGLWRWTYARDQWDKLGDSRGVDAIAAVRGELVQGHEDGTLVTPDGRRINAGDSIVALVPSWDGRWLVAQLRAGGAALFDTRTWQLVRTLAPADNYGAWPTFDASGELLLRTSRQSIAIWETTTGDELVFGLELIPDVLNARFLADGRIEVNGREPALLDIPRDTRPASQIAAEIACRVPLEVVDSRIQPRAPTCQ